jgi:hypothetical protein
MFPCNICQRTFNAQFALEDHYRGSAVHPNCVKCGKGFRDAAGREEVPPIFVLGIISY